MLRKKSLLISICLIIILVSSSLVISCSQTVPASNLSASAIPPGTNTSTPVDKVPVTSPALTGVAVLTWQDLSRFIDSDPADVDNSKFPITPVEEIGVTGIPPGVDIATYNLVVDGLVKNPLKLSYETLLRYPAVTETVLLICPGFFVDNAEWTGIPMADLLNEAGIEPEASQVVFHALGGYRQSFTLEDIQNDGAFLAHTVNGLVLPEEHGYPLRLVIKGLYGGHWVKWINRIEITK